MFANQKGYNEYLRKKWRVKKVKKYENLRGASADEILRACNQEATIPIDLSEILKSYEVSALPIDFTKVQEKLCDKTKTEILGAIITNEKGIAIFYNSEMKGNNHRTRFTIAHELAHYCLSNDSSPHIEFRTNDLTEDEIAANTFAGELLIPRKSLETAMSELLVPTVSALADIFDVSVNVMSERIKFLGLSGEVAQ